MICLMETQDRKKHFSPVSPNFYQLLFIMQMMRTAVLLLLVSLVIADGHSYSLS